MNAKRAGFFPLLILIFALGFEPDLVADQLTLEFQPGTSQGQIGIHSTMSLPVSSMYSEYTIQRSTNLTSWQTVSGPISGKVGVSDELLRVALTNSGNRAFYRAFASVKLAPAESRVGDAVFGYGTEFSRQIQLIGQLSLNRFVQIYTPTNTYLPQISFNPTTAEFWNQFNLDPAVHNATNSADPRLTDFRLNTNEFAVFKTNGFVVSPRLGSYSFADSFYKIFTDDLPVFFSTDAALHAWHRSYIAMLEELEETYLSPTLQTMVTTMGQQVSTLSAQSANTALTNGVLDADYFLAVARSLVTGTNYFGSLGQTTRIQNTLISISNLQPATVMIFGANRTVDFSQFQVRGHYDTSERLQKYFRASMWCSLIDFRFTGATNDNSLRELSGAVAMHLLMQNSGQFANWQKFDSILQMFVGVPDSLTFAQLSDLLAAAKITSPANLPNQAALQNLQAQIMSGQLGVQSISSGYFFSPLTSQQIKLPRSFTLSGQRFVMDSWTMGKCVFDDIIWNSNGIPGFQDKVMRRVPSALDVAFSVFGNNQIVPELAERIANTKGHPWRDGLPYQHNLAAVRSVVDLQNSSAWTNNIYNSWLACLRELSTPTTAPEFPQVMRTRSWALKTLNTQLASWTQLRHDTLLYAKEPYTRPVLCSYPAGFIEPRVNFWLRMQEMAQRTRDLMATLPQNGPPIVFEPNQGDDAFITNSVGVIYTNRLQHLDNFASVMNTLRQISQKELLRQPLTTNEATFLENLIENKIYYGNGRNYSGWYPRLFYRNVRTAYSSLEPSEQWDAIVTDVHTDPKDLLVGDPGSILHEAVGNVHLMMIAVDCGPGDTAVYAGPVMSHYEFELGPTTRKTDAQWKSEVRAGTLPPQPEWTKSYLVPGAYSFPTSYY